MKPALTLAFGLILGCAPCPEASAQTPAGLDIQIYAGLTITGSVGTVYSVEYVSDLAQSNNPAAWRCLEYLQLPASPYLWADKSAPATGKRFYRAMAMEAPVNMVFIPPGMFRMGSPTNEVDRWDYEGPQTEVTISRGFWMGKYEVTQGEYLAVMGFNPSYFSTNHGFAPDLDRPAETLGGEGGGFGDLWGCATNYCWKLTQQERAAVRISVNSVYRLPTEAEWEYACRAGTSTRFSYGDDPGYTNLTNHAWYPDNSRWTTHPVGQKLPNLWGLYDMHGNVWECCQDRWSSNLPGGIVLDPQGPDSGLGLYRTFRGGGFGNPSHPTAGACRSACRTPALGDFTNWQVGFRVVLASGPP